MSSTSNLPSPLFANEGHDTALWQREDRRDLIIECLHTYELLNMTSAYTILTLTPHHLLWRHQHN
jgi:hypothetical protein